jgi:hypothetical protein
MASNVAFNGTQMLTLGCTGLKKNPVINSYLHYALQAAKLEPNHMPARYAIAVHRIRDAVRSQCYADQLLWAANEMATVLKEGDPSAVDAPIAWAGLAMAHRAQHEIAAAYDAEHINLSDAEERALYTLKQVMFCSLF